MPVLIWKEVGETPLEALERYRAREVAGGRTDLSDAPMTYAGRLDPMAEGELLILVGAEACRAENKARYLGLDKEYEVEIVFGIETDTYDALGLAVLGQGAANQAPHEPASSASDFSRFVGRFRQEYPAYSSRMLSRKGKTTADDETPPTKEVEIYSIDLLGSRSIDAVDLRARIFDMIDKVKGDFRQEKIKKRWDEALAVVPSGGSFEIIHIRVKCSSGTYMRSLAHRIGGFALTIRRMRLLEPEA